MLTLLFSVMSLVAVSLLNNRLASTLPPLVFFVHPLLFFQYILEDRSALFFSCFSIVFLTRVSFPPFILGLEF